jgi:hypothetical protein
MLDRARPAMPRRHRFPAGAGGAATGSSLTFRYRPSRPARRAAVNSGSRASGAGSPPSDARCIRSAGARHCSPRRGVHAEPPRRPAPDKHPPWAHPCKLTKKPPGRAPRPLLSDIVGAAAAKSSAMNVSAWAARRRLRERPRPFVRGAVWRALSRPSPCSDAVRGELPRRATDPRRPCGAAEKGASGVSVRRCGRASEDVRMMLIGLKKALKRTAASVSISAGRAVARSRN